MIFRSSVSMSHPIPTRGGVRVIRNVGNVVGCGKSSAGGRVVGLVDLTYEIPEHDRPYLRKTIPVLTAGLSRRSVGWSSLGLNGPDDTMAAYFGFYVVIEHA